MKRIVKIFIVAMVGFFATELTADAQLLKNILKKATSATESATATASSSGQAAGAALKSLYSQYKADGKLDMSNLNNLMNLATLANNVKGLKGMTSKTDFYKDFATGLVSGSNNLVNSSNSSSIMGGLQNLVNNVDLSGLQGNATTAITKGTEALSNANEIASSVTSILNMFKK
ncbi:MAG: hypothetical protein IKU33_09230 [Bacteroidales bacterium]|nr:hypothetical protein [Bacteroidales bacterium]